MSEQAPPSESDPAPVAGSEPRRTEPDMRAAVERARMALRHAAELATERGFKEWADALGKHSLAMDVALTCKCGGTGELPSEWPCVCDVMEQHYGVSVQVREVSPGSGVTAEQVEAGARVLCPTPGAWSRFPEKYRRQARLVLEAAREAGGESA